MSAQAFARAWCLDQCPGLRRRPHRLCVLVSVPVCAGVRAGLISRLVSQSAQASVQAWCPSQSPSLRRRPLGVPVSVPVCAGVCAGLVSKSVSLYVQASAQSCCPVQCPGLCKCYSPMCSCCGGGKADMEATKILTVRYTFGGGCGRIKSTIFLGVLTPPAPFVSNFQ